MLLVKQQRLQTVRVTSRRIPIQLRQYLLLSKLASFPPNTSYLQHKCFNEPLPTTTKLRTTTKFLSGPVGCQDFDESSRSTGTPFNIHLQQTAHSLFFLLPPFSHQPFGEKTLQTVLAYLEMLGYFCFSIASESQKKKSLKHTKTYFFLFFCTLFAKNGLFAIWPPFLNRRLLINGSFLSIVTFHMVNVKRVVLR